MMARHPSFEQLRALAAGDAPSRAPIAEHLQDCTDCRRTITVVRDVVAVARAEFSPPAPAAALDRILARRLAGERVLLPVADESAVPTPPRAALRVAMITGALLTIAGIAAAVPGSPVHRWLTRDRTEPTAAAAPISTEASAATAISGVAISIPATGEAWIAIDSAPAEVRIRVRVTDGAMIEVRGVGSAARSRFSPRATGIGVTDVTGGNGEFQVDIPRRAGRVVLRVGGAPFLIKEGARLRVLSTADTMGAELLFSPWVRP